MASDRTKQLLGELLTEAGLIQIDDLREAANIARSQGLPIGKVLVMSGYISKELLQAAVEMQSRLKDNLIQYDIGIKALKLVDTNQISLDAALTRLGITARPLDSTSNRLGAILIGADLLTKNDFDTALEESQRCGLPLGRVLSNLAMIPDRIVDMALNVQKMLRSGKMSKDEAVKTLVDTKEGKINPESLTEVQANASPTAANIVNSHLQNSIAQQANAQEAITQAQEPITSVQGPTTQVQPIVPEQVKTQQTGSTEKSGVFPDLDSLSLHHMLRIAGLIQTDALEAAIRESLENPDVMGIILKRSGLLEEFVIEAAKECCQLIASGAVKPEQAIIALHQCQRTRSSIKDCLEEFGWIEKSKIPS